MSDFRLAEMADTDKIRLVEEHYESFWHGDLDDFDRQMSSDFVDVSAPPGTPPGPGPVKQYAAMVRSVFDPMQVTVEDALVSGNVVAVVARWRGHQVIDYLGLPGGRDVEFAGIVVWELDDTGRIARRTAFFDPATALGGE